MRRILLPRLRTDREPQSRRTWRSAWRFGAGGAVGAGLMFLLDPNQGRRRRALTRDRTAGTMRHGARRFQRLGRRTGADAYGVWRKLLFAWRPAEPAPNPQTLTDRVLSEVYRDQEIPHGRLNVNVEEDVVVLRGQLDDPNDIRHVENRIRKVPGVQDVRSYIHLPNTPAPNKEDALHAE